MVSQYCHLMDSFTWLVENAMINDEKAARVAESHICQSLIYKRQKECGRSSSRKATAYTRTIDGLIPYCYHEGGHMPFEPWMFEEAVSNAPFSLDLLLQDIEVFLNFEIGSMRYFWLRAKDRALKTTYVSDDGRTERSHIAAEAERAKKKSIWDYPGNE